ncbi:glycosyltransferase family 1 protein [Sphingomonas sp. ABOLG]|jgi:phosphatidylinositol alpha 1,6-mannosyltransferase|uniref:Glycosyltransferase family 1 protein n=1 Tax=Sphingomonas olei TaxID=1886787 RepID=A0ABY2QID9_9SPHN|nr:MULTISPECIES: glycosyltransferase family 1 protein [Sphingomonas]KKI17549.1 glycosyl transferase family 1 [Sphingomonas sp. Ag1]RSV18773.1 glycosyltransferase family 1 protein [Sphingomonas sp. ABOLG]THG40492.1 glycosyltransferase family 1 protein [Sphingomonas olei]
MQPSDLRVALFSGNYNYTRDGANQALNLLVGHLLSRGAQVRVYSPTVDQPAFPPTGDLVDVPALPLPGERGEYRLARGLPAQVRRDLKAFAPNLIHVSAPDILGHRAISYARRNGIARVASLHTRFETYPRYYGLGFLEPMVERLLTRFYNRAERVLVPGLLLGEILQTWGVRTPTAVWSRGVNHDRFSPARRDLAWRRHLGIGDDEVAVGFLGRLVKEKGLDIFANVVGELRQRNVRHRVLVIGEGPARDWFAEQVPDAAFAGFQSGDDLGRAVASMDVFFNPSVTETFGNVTLEAMAAGVPVVAARASGAVGLVDEGETGRLVEPRDVPGYADAIAELVASRDARLRMGRNGTTKAAGYRWEMINEAVLSAYLQVLEERSRP